ncbi:MAG: cell division protein ZapD, partial [Glaciecola sp.]
MSHTLYEYPLNEKVRTYLRFEHFFSQLSYFDDCSSDTAMVGYLETIFTLLDVLERGDLKSDIIRDLDIHEKNLAYWANHPNIDLNAINKAKARITRLQNHFKRSGKIGSALKEDRFLRSIKQRFSIPGGTCNFDLPNLHFWLKQSLNIKTEQVAKWNLEFEHVKEAIATSLTFLREQSNFISENAGNGLFQGSADEKVELLRIHCASDEGYYPVVSGNKYR